MRALTVFMPYYLSEWLYARTGTRRGGVVVFSKKTLERKAWEGILQGANTEGVKEPPGYKPRPTYDGVRISVAALMVNGRARKPLNTERISRRAVQAIVKVLRSIFDVELAGFVALKLKETQSLKHTLYAFMQMHRISAAHYDVVCKRFLRLKKATYN